MTNHDDGSWHSVSLSIHSKELHPDDIGIALRATPTRISLRGEKISPRNPESQMREMSIWTKVFRARGADSLEADFAQLIDFLGSRTTELRKIRSQIEEVRVRLGFSSSTGQSSFMVESKDLQPIFDVEADLWVDLFPHS